MIVFNSVRTEETQKGERGGGGFAHKQKQIIEIVKKYITRNRRIGELGDEDTMRPNINSNLLLEQNDKMTHL